MAVEIDILGPTQPEHGLVVYAKNFYQMHMDQLAEFENELEKSYNSHPFFNDWFDESFNGKAKAGNQKAIVSAGE